jgi:adenylyltransferase/sulfurtransferase
MSIPEIHAEEFGQRLAGGDDLFLLDVRNEDEYEKENIGGHHIPLAELPRRIAELDPQRRIVVICKMGARSLKAAQLLQRAGFQQVWNLAGGLYGLNQYMTQRVRNVNIPLRSVPAMVACGD